jgi:hypothetical protein
MFFLLIGIIIWLYSLKRFQQSLLWFLTYKVFLVTNINILSVPGLPVLTLDMGLTLWFCFWVYQKRQIYHGMRMPYTTPMIIVLAAYFISTIFAVAGFKTVLSSYIKDVCNILLTSWMIWKAVNTEKDFLILFKRLCAAFLITCIYGLIENVLQSNPLVEYESSLVNDSSKVVDFNYGIDEYRGYRVQSVFEHAIGAGMNWAMFLIFVMYVFEKTKHFFHRLNNKLLPMTVILCGLCLFLTNCRGPILFVMIALLGLVDLRSKRSYKIFWMIIVAVFMGSFFMEESYINNLISIFDSSYQSKVGGSSSEQRLDQMGGAIAIVSQSPIFGLGYKFQSVMNYGMVRRLLGLESIWLRTIVQFGGMGVIANLILAYYMVIKIPLRFKQKHLIFFNAAYWVTASLTSLPGILMYLYYLINFFFIKQSEVYKLNLSKEYYES